MAGSLYSHDVADRRDTPNKRAAAQLAHALRGGHGGYWTDDRRRQTEAFKNDVYLAWSAVARAVQGTTAQLTTLRKNASLGRMPGAKSFLTKALPTPHAHANDEQRRPVVAGPLVKLFERPNARETLATFLAKWFMQQTLTGNVLVWGNPDRVGRVKEMFILPTALCQWQPYRSDEFPVGAWRVMPYYAGGAAGVMPYGVSAGALIPAHQVTHYRMPHPLYHWDGYAPATACGKWVDVVEQIDRTLWGQLNNTARYGRYIGVAGMPQHEADDLNAQIRQRNAGPDNAGLPFVIGTANPDAEIVINDGHPPSDMEYREGRETYASLVLALIGVPPTVAGVKEAGGHAELYAAVKQFRDLTLTPWLTAVAAELTSGPVATWDDGDDDLKLQFDLPQVLNEDIAEQVKGRQQANGLTTHNQSLRGDNLPPSDDPMAEVLPTSLFFEHLKRKHLPDPPPPPTGGVGGGGGGDPDELPAGPGGGAGGDNPPRPGNPAGEGSLPPRGPQAKALDLRAGFADWKRRRGVRG